MRKLFAAPLALFSSWGWAQQLVAVAPPSDSSGLLVLAVLAIAGGLIFLKVKKPALFAKLLGKGLKLKSAAGVAFDKLKDDIPVLTDKVKVEPRVPVPEPLVQLEPVRTPAQLIAYLRENHPDLLREPAPTPAEYYAGKQTPATAGPRIVDGQLMA